MFPAAVESVWVDARDVALAVEVVSPNDLRSAIAAKVDRYLAAGVRAVWVIHPTERRIDQRGDAGALDGADLADHLWR